MKRVIVLDRDGVINKELGRHVLSWDEFEFMPGALEAIALLTRQGYKIAIATNQSCLDSGLLSTHDFDVMSRHMLHDVIDAGGDISSLHVCPHTPFARCDCRKPKPGMLIRIAQSYNVSTHDLIMIGNSASDISAAFACGATPVLISDETDAQKMVNTIAKWRINWPSNGGIVQYYSSLLEYVKCLISAKPASA